MRRLYAPAAVLLLLAAGVGGWWQWRERQRADSPDPVRERLSTPLPGPASRLPRAPREPAPEPAGPDLSRLAALLDDTPKRANEALLYFKSDADLEAFLARQGKRLTTLGVNRTLRAVRVGFASPDDLLRDAGPEAEIGANYLVSLPRDPAASPVNAQAGALGFGPYAVAFLGGTGDRSAWGRGITIGLVDSGVASHPAFGGRAFPAIDLAGGGDNAWHGTAVASLMVSTSDTAPGLAPGANLVSVRVTGADGFSDVFTLADAVQRAADAGAQVINVSMGASADSPLLRSAVAYAQQRGAVVVAAAGNDGLAQLAYPAGYPGVLSVGGIEAAGNHVAFSNTGASLQLSAPGYGVNAAGSGDQYVQFSGTSASAPLVSAALAAVMSELKVSAAQAAELLVTYANDAGAPGPDPVFGAGILNVERVLQRNTPGIHDTAVSGVVLQDGQTVVTVQNRGTEPVSGAKLTVQLPGHSQSFSLPTLAPNTIESVRLPAAAPAGTPLTVQASVTTGGRTDAHPTDNTITSQFTPGN